MAWFDKCPERLEDELRALNDANFEYEIDEDKRAAGQLVLTVKVPIVGTVHSMRVLFPAQYPFFAFQIDAQTLSLSRHQNPYSKALCFVGDIQTEWKTTDTVAMYLSERLPLVLKSNEDPSAPEAREGAPVTGYLTFAPESVVLVDDWIISSDQQRGTLLIGIEPGSDPNRPLRGAVLEVNAADGKRIAEANERLKRRYDKIIKGRWTRLPARPEADDPIKIMADAIVQWPKLERCEFNGGPDTIGVLFPDEAQHRQLHDIWSFLVRYKQKTYREVKGRRRPTGSEIRIYLARPDRAGRSDLQARVPRLNQIAKKKVAIFGVGALGSMVAWQLARAGMGAMTLIDHDFYQYGTAPRWLLGLPAAGHTKVSVLKAFIEHNYPYVDVTPIVYAVGNHVINAEQAEEAMKMALEGADLILDCTVEFTVGHYLSSIARERGIPYVWARGSTGAWGGIVGRARPGEERGCWKCFYHHFTAGAYPFPAEEDGPDVQPVGCFSPTFTGAGFDLDHISLMAVRLAVSTLCAGTEDGYPDFNWDVGILDLWDKVARQPIAPRWTTSTLTKHKDCDGHE